MGTADLEKNHVSLYRTFKIDEQINECGLLSWKHHNPALIKSWIIEYYEQCLFSLVKEKGTVLHYRRKKKEYFNNWNKTCHCQENIYIFKYKLLMSFEVTFIFPLAFINIPQGISLPKLRTYGLNISYLLTWLYSVQVFLLTTIVPILLRMKWIMIKFNWCSWRPQLVYILTRHSYTKQLLFNRTSFNPYKAVRKQYKV